MDDSNLSGSGPAMEDGRVERLIERLWGTGPEMVYAVLDGARDGRIHPEVTRAELPYHCLFTGALSTELAEASPYLVQLNRHSAVTTRLLRQGWGQSWGIFCASTAPMEEVWRHFRRFLRVLGPDGQRLYFRYYDPRVLRAFLPECNGQELLALFGPISHYMVEGEDAAKLIVYRRLGEQLSASPIEWGEDG